MKNGNLVISLDFELYWGIFDKVNIEDKVKYFNNTISIIPKILTLYQKYNIEATWASVGMLFNNDIDELKKNLPEFIPNYLNTKISAYKYIDSLYNNKYKKFHFAPDLINLINKTKGQEISTHTYSHYYCLEKGQTIKEFDSDIKISRKLAAKNNITIKSIVFPRNQYNENYNLTCLKNNINVIRTNPNIWFWNSLTKETIIKKIFRTGDCYIPLSKTPYKLLINKNVNLLELPASRFLRPLSKYKILNKLRNNRIKREMTYAAKHNKIYHLWWHPHNFGDKPKQSLIELEELLNHYKLLKNKYKFQSINMSNMYSQINH